MNDNVAIDLMPEFTRHRILIELIPMINTDYPQLLHNFLIHLAKINKLRRYLGPIVISPQTFKKTLFTPIRKLLVNTFLKDVVIPVEAHKPEDKNFFLIWEKSHVFGYHYKNGLLAIEMSLCSQFNSFQTLEYVYHFFRPVKNTMRYIYINKNPKVMNKWKPFSI